MFLAADERESQEMRHFLLAPVLTRDIDRFNLNCMWLGMHGVESIPYFIDFDNYSKLFTVLDRLEKALDEYRTGVADDVALMTRVLNVQS